MMIVIIVLLINKFFKHFSSQVQVCLNQVCAHVAQCLLSFLHLQVFENRVFGVQDAHAGEVSMGLSMDPLLQGSRALGPELFFLIAPPFQGASPDLRVEGLGVEPHVGLCHCQGLPGCAPAAPARTHR